MPRAERTEVIRQIEAYRKSRVIAFVLGDRANLVTAIADDAVRVIYNHLATIGKTELIDVFIYTRGGVGVAPARIVHLIREHAQRMDALVPYRCLSGGTVLCCGANNIVMHEMGELSPVDATTNGIFNPQDRFGRPLGIGVEDVRAYLSLANSWGLKSEATIVEIFKLLSSQINVIALGNIQRVYNTGVNLMPDLLKLHLDETKDKERIDRIIQALSQTYTHDYLIPRKEAKEIGLPVSEPDEKLANLMWRLFEMYEKDLMLRTPFVAELPIDQNSLDFRYETAYLETTSRTDAFLQEGTITRSPPQPQPQPIQFGLPGLPQPVVPAQPQIPGLPLVKFKRQAWTDVTV